MNLINVVFNSKTQKNQLTSQKFHGISTQTPKCTSVVERNNKFPNLFLPSTLVRHFLNVNVIFLGEEASNQPVGQTPTAKRQEKKGGRCRHLWPVAMATWSRWVSRQLAVEWEGRTYVAAPRVSLVFHEIFNLKKIKQQTRVLVNMLNVKVWISQWITRFVVDGNKRCAEHASGSSWIIVSRFWASTKPFCRWVFTLTIYGWYRGHRPVISELTVCRWRRN